MFPSLVECLTGDTVHGLQPVPADARGLENSEAARKVQRTNIRMALSFLVYEARLP